MAKFYANPYDSSARGFYFESPEAFDAGVRASRVEEFEIDFIDGDDTETALAKAVPPSQGDIEAWYNLLDEVESDSQLLLQIVGFAECSHRLDGVSDFEANRRYIEDVSIDEGTLEELAERFVEEGTISLTEWDYFDIGSFANDLRYDGYSSDYLNPEGMVGSDEAKEELVRGNYVFDPDFNGSGDNADDVVDGIEAGTVYVGMTLREYAEQYIEDAGITQKMAEQYADYAAIARDLAIDGYTEFRGPDGNTYCYRRY
jgi:antirestriction protein